MWRGKELEPNSLQIFSNFPKSKNKKINAFSINYWATFWMILNGASVTLQLYRCLKLYVFSCFCWNMQCFYWPPVLFLNHWAWQQYNNVAPTLYWNKIKKKRQVLENDHLVKKSVSSLLHFFALLLKRFDIQAFFFNIFLDSPCEF